MSEESATERLRFAALVAVACVLLSVPRLLLHELWRDEAWLWLVVTESSSLADLFPPLARSGQGLPLSPALLSGTAGVDVTAGDAARASWSGRRRSLRFRPLGAVRPPQAAAGIGLALAGAVAGLVQLIPEPGTSFAPGWRFGWDPVQAGKALMMPWRAFVPRRPGRDPPR